MTFASYSWHYTVRRTSCQENILLFKRVYSIDFVSVQKKEEKRLEEGDVDTGE